mmetsp:Transcript_3512/g.8690  ORF Transcript_3512/g.8690 Transcript_3512/m.8690 type:complete len:88 (+) Transcript_3512:196-459(+)
MRHDGPVVKKLFGIALAQTRRHPHVKWHRDTAQERFAASLSRKPKQRRGKKEQPVRRMAPVRRLVLASRRTTDNATISAKADGRLIK